MQQMVGNIVITGIGIISSMGEGKEQTIQSLRNAESRVGQITHFPVDDFPVQIAAEVKDFAPEKYIDKKQVRKIDRAFLFGIAAAKMALEDSQLVVDDELADDFGVVVTSGIGGFNTLSTVFVKFMDRGPSRVSPFLVPMMLADMAAGMVSIELGLRGPNYSVVSACASSLHSIASAASLLQQGQAKAVLAGGTEGCITPLVIAAFNAMSALSRRNEDPKHASRPFDTQRDGFVMSEGSAIFVLEREEDAIARGAKIYARLKGYGMSGDAYHMAAPDPEGKGSSRSIARALKHANMTANQIDVVNCHATSTPSGDAAEIKAISHVLGDHARSIPIVSTKSIYGHGLGAAGGIEVASMILCLQNGFIHPTINLEQPDPQLEGFDFVPNRARSFSGRHFLKNSFGFGGHNISLIFEVIG